MKQALHIIIYMWALCLYFPAVAFADGGRFLNVGIDDASTVCGMAQDKYGMMWLGTDCGLYSYDGYRTVARYRQGTTQNVRIYSLCIDGDKIYLGTDNGVLIYDIRKGCYTDGPQRKLSEVRAMTMWHGDLWLGAAEGLFRMKTNSLDMQPVGKGLHNVYSLLSRKRQLLVGTIGGLGVMGNGGKMHSVSMPGNRKILVNALCDDAANGCIWVGTEGAMFRFDGHSLTAVPSLQGNSVKSFATDGMCVYVGTDNGLYTYSPKMNSVSLATHDSREQRSIANNIVWSLLADRWGNLWAGTDQGLSMLAGGRQDRNVPLADIAGNGDGNCLHAIFRHADGSVWMGGSNGLIACDAASCPAGGDMKASAWYRFNSPRFPLSHNRVRRIVNDADDRLLVCTDHGINIYNPSTRQFANVVVTDATGRYTTAWAYDILDDGQGRYWIASYMGGIFVIEKNRMLGANGTVTADRHILGQLQGMHVWQLARDGKGRIWACLNDHGLDCIDVNSLKVSHMTSSDEHVNYIVTDRKGNVWAAMENSVCCFSMSGKDGRKVSVAGSGSGGVSMLAEVEGDIWAFRGRQCTVIRSDGTADCFAVKTFTPLAIYYDRLTHSVMLGGNDCLLTLPVASARDAMRGQRLMLSAIEVDGKVFEPKDGSASFVSAITLAYRQNNLEFLFTDMPMQGLPPRSYAYKLEGADRTWQYMDAADMQINYNSLPSGHYKLHLRTASGDIDNADDVYTLDVRILPPWYLSLWMKIVYWLLAIALLWWIAKFCLMRRRLKEERAVKERVLRQLENRQAFFDNLSRRLKEPLSHIFSSLLTMLHRVDNTTEATRLERMWRDATAINRLVGECLDSSLASAGVSAQKEKAHVEVVGFCRRIVDDARSEHGRKAAFEFRTDALDAYVDTDITRLQTVLERLLAFAAVQSGRTAVQGSAPEPVVLAVDNGEASIAVSVTIPGVSLEESEVPFVFNRYLATEDGRDIPESDALAGVKDFATAEGATASASLSGSQLVVTLAFTDVHRPVQPHAAQKAPVVADVSLEPESADARLLAKVTAAIEQNMSDSDFNVTRLQEILGLGSKLLYRKVKQTTGKTPVEFIRHIRMQHAASLLRKGKFAVSEVMYMVGYSNSSYFSKCFQKTYGITPAEYARGLSEE